MSQLYGNQSKSFLSDLVKQGNNSFKALGYQQLTVTSSVQNLTIPDGARYALMILESDAVAIAARYLEFGGVNTPVSIGVGMPLSNLSVLDITDAHNLVGFQIILETPSTTKLNIQYYK